jgi:hypothetical protein
MDIIKIKISQTMSRFVNDFGKLGILLGTPIVVGTGLIAVSKPRSFKFVENKPNVHFDVKVADGSDNFMYVQTRKNSSTTKYESFYFVGLEAISKSMDCGGIKRFYDYHKQDADAIRLIGFGTPAYFLTKCFKENSTK